MNRSRLSFVAGMTTALLFGAVLAFAPTAFAQGTDTQSGMAAFAEAAGFSAAPLPLVIARLVRSLISFLGIVIVAYVLYGGFLYMTAGGDATRVDAAKRVLRNAIVGFAIVISSFAIASFVITRVSEAVGTAGISGSTDSEVGCPGCVDGHVNGRRNFALSGWNQQCGGWVRNAQLQWTFTQPVSAGSVTNAQKPGIQIKDAAGAVVDGTFAVRGNVVSFTPSAACPGAAEEKCFDAAATYDVTFFPTVLRSATGAQYQCGGLFEPCTDSFTTGTAVDVTRPTVDMIQPPVTGMSAAVGGIVPLQARIRDDVGGSLALFFVEDAGKPVFSAGVGTDSNARQVALDNVFSTDETEWDTAAYGAGTYDTWVVGVDCAGHEAQTPKHKIALVSAQCVNGVKDGTETAVDCGGSCGACAGGACRITTDCTASLTCREGSCVSTPRVDRVVANDGAVGNLITISGDGFGADAGTVVFLGDPAEPADDVTAVTAAMCGPGAWKNTQAVVQVPLGAKSGPLELRTASFSADRTKADRTNDTFGARLSDFTVNGVVRPGLCAIAPTTGMGSIAAVLSGLNFGAVRGETGSIYFGNYTAAAYGAWGATSAEVTVPRLDAGTYPVQLFVGGKTCTGTTTACTEDKDCTAPATCVSNRQGSNPVSFAVQTLPTQTPPRISGVDPAQGPVNQYVTVSGVNFGSAGLVYLREVAGAGRSAIGSVEFPEACGTSFWSDTSAVIKIPLFFADKFTPIVPGKYTLTIDRGGVVSEGIPFEITSGSAGPGVCRLHPTSGPIGTAVTAIGDNLTGTNRFVFRDNKTSPAEALNGNLIAAVAAGAVTGPVVVQRTGPESASANAVPFAVGSCKDGSVACTNGTQCCANGTCSLSCGAVAVDGHYAYMFSTGPIPQAPRVIVACDRSGSAPSPSPWDGWSKAGTVCPNAVVTAAFDRPMDRAFMQAGSVRVQKCTGPVDDRCKTTDAALTGVLASSTDTSFAWQKEDRTPLDAGATYRVTLAAAGFRSATKKSADGVELGLEPLAGDYSWQFSTAASGAPCTIGGVVVQPDQMTATAPDQTVNYSAAPLAKEDRCVMLACASDMAFAWNSDHPNQIDLANTAGACTQVATVRSAISDNNSKAVITAQLTNVSAAPSDDATLTVDFEDPNVVESWPSCDAACLNADIGARFNVPMEPADFTTSTVELFACENAVCAPARRTKVNAAVAYIGANGSHVTLTPSNSLQPDTYYQMRIAGSVRALRTSSLLSDSYNGGDFTSIFRTDRTGQACGIDRISVEPKEVMAKRVGEKATFTATPFGAPDACSPTGQRLNPMSYEWNAWTALDTPDRVPAARTAFLWPPASTQQGALLLYSANQLPASCASNCLNAGAQAVAGEALCGNGRVEAGEDCDGGPSCTSICLRAEAKACDATLTTNCCGNGKTEGLEECDLGKAGGSICTPGCLNAGSNASYCGNGKTEEEAGEECDDRNRIGGDGCSSVCLHEGTKARSAVLAICGNSVREAGEDCDDGNAVSGDGCSVLCLHEGAQGGAVCGNGSVESGAVGSATGPRGEDCDDGNAVSGDGCSDTCVREGSSARYAIPSFCGNGGLPEMGEECEVVAPTGAPKLQPLGVAVIDVTAPQEIDPKETDPAKRIARSTVTAQETGTSKKGQATIALTCSCSTDDSCGAGGYACGTSNCCVERAQVVGISPNQSGDVCRNADVWVEFSKAMDTKSLQGNLFLEAHHASGAACAAAGGTMSALTVASAPVGIIGRVIAFAQSFFSGESAFAQNTDAPRYCLIPIAYSIEGNKIHASLQKVLSASTDYRLVVVADDNVLDAAKVGVRSADQATLDPQNAGAGALSYLLGGQAGLSAHLVAVTSFTTGTQICAIDHLDAKDDGKLDAAGSVVSPPQDKSFNFLTVAGEQHKVSATARSKDGQAISPVAPYTWELSWGSTIADSDTAKNVVSTTGTPAAPTVTANNVNGPETVFAEATVKTSADGLPAVGTVSRGAIGFEALICSNPSKIGAVNVGTAQETNKPYVQAETNFGFTYCRDFADPKKVDDDLPELTVAQVPNSPVGAFREFLYKLAGTPDGLGVRVISNDGYLTPAAWYAKQGFKGSPSPTKVDGYEAVQDGNTWYVFAPNYAVNAQTGKATLYPQIYVISYNPDARPASQEAFKRILSTWRFNANQAAVTDYNLCRVTATGDYLKNAKNAYVSCTWDGDCLDRCIGGKVCSASGAACAQDADCPQANGTSACDGQKAKIRRDTKRLQDVVVMKAAFDQLGGRVPELASGTFLRTLAVSAWPSWTAALGNAVGTALPTDPINDFYGCTGSGYDRETCFNSAASQFVCPAKSQVYGFQSVGGDSYTLSARLEYAAAAWNKPIDLNSTDKVTISVENAKDTVLTGQGFIPGDRFCAGTVVGTSSSCGDGVKATDEVCELGEVRVDTTACATGYQNVACVKNASTGQCEWQAGGACVSYACGNGTKEAGEDCDDGARNGTYGSRCNAQCRSYNVASAASGFSFCGDGFLSGGEQCDCGTSDNFLPLLNAYASPLDGNWAKANACGAPNGNYSLTISRSCSLDCRKPGPSCGDGIVQANAGETCEGTQEEVATGFCAGTSQGCTTNTQCANVNGGAGAVCAPFVNSRVCEKGLASKIGSVCVANADCDTSAIVHDGKCSVGTYPLVTSRVCLAAGSANQCTFGAPAAGWSEKYAKGQPACGNGKKEGAEQCDDGNLKDDDACTSECALNVCGDGKVQKGVEACDYGSQNGNSCTPSYGSTCNYCTNQCQRKTVSGAYCGDGVINGNEFCDGTAVKNICSKATGTTFQVAGPCLTDAECDAGFQCRRLGVCNGGAKNGEVCQVSYVGGTPVFQGTLTDSCGAGSTCVFPSCTTSCSSACPFNLETAVLKVQPEGSNATSTSIDLFAAGSGTPDGGFLTIPACTAATQFFADVDDAKLVYPKIDIVFVTDISGSMTTSVGGGKTRMEVAKASIHAAIDELFDTYTKATLRVGLVSFGYSNTAATAARQDKGLLPATQRQELLDTVDAYAATGGYTPTYYGVQQGIALIQTGDPTAKKFVILMTDGDPTGGEAVVTQVYNLMRMPDNSAISFSSAAITTDQHLIGWTAHMSSELCGGSSSAQLAQRADCQPKENVRYAYDGGTEAAIRDMYANIIDGILGVTLRYLTTTNQVLTGSAGTVRSGKGIPLPFPDGFVCDPTGGSKNVRFSVAFNAGGAVNFSNFKMTYCPVR